MELNNEAYSKAIKAWEKEGSTLRSAITAYLASIEAQKNQKPQPFDVKLVKCGDPLMIEGIIKDRVYVGMMSDNRVVTEAPGGVLNHWPASSVQIPPAPKKTVKVAVFRSTASGRKYTFFENECSNSNGFDKVSDWVEIPINEGGEV